MIGIFSKFGLIGPHQYGASAGCAETVVWMGRYSKARGEQFGYLPGSTSAAKAVELVAAAPDDDDHGQDDGADCGPGVPRPMVVGHAGRDDH